MEREHIAILIVGVLLVGAFPTAYYFADSTQRFTFIQLVGIIESFSTVVLSLLLIFLYLELMLSQEKQVDITETQADISGSQTGVMESQTEIMDSQLSLQQLSYLPNITIIESYPDEDLDKWELAYNPHKSIAGLEESTFVAKLDNNGNGIATNMNIKIKASCQVHEGADIQYIDIENLMFWEEIDHPDYSSIVRSNVEPFLEKGQSESNSLQTTGGYLRPGETGVFAGILTYSITENIPPGNKINYSFIDVIEILGEHEELLPDTSILYTIWLYYEDQIGESHVKLLDKGEFHIPLTASLENVGGRIRGFGHRRTSKDEILEEFRYRV